MKLSSKVCCAFAALSLCVQISSQAPVEVEVPSATEITSQQLQGLEKSLNNNIAANINNFGYKLLLKMMNEKKNENIVISPTGIAGLLAMTLLGTVGRTYDELADVLGFSQDIFANRKNHEELGALLQSVNTSDSSKTVYADAIFVDTQTPLRQLYRNYLHDVYHGEILNTDFKQTEDAKNIINEWVNNHTNGLIDKFLKDTLPTSTKVALLSALYFSGEWEHSFIPEHTMKLPFKKANEEVIADLMLNIGQFPFTISDHHDFIMIALPYNDSQTSMYALKPRLPKKMSLIEVMEKLDFDTIEDAINELKAKKCVVRFPKMDLKTSVNLGDSLKAIGLHDMFIPGSANFALMVNGNTIVNKTEEELITRIDNKVEDMEESTRIKIMLDSLPNPGIHVDSVMHDVKITINEYGTEAVAATGAILARTAEQFYADSPFYMFIRNSKTKLVTFSAVIFDPTVG